VKLRNLISDLSATLGRRPQALPPWTNNPEPSPEPDGPPETPQCIDVMSTLDRIHDDVTYAIESLLERLSGEAKHELTRVAGITSESEYLNQATKDQILSPVWNARDALVLDSGDEMAQQILINLRRRLRNTLDEMSGRRHSYTVQYAPPLPIERVEHTE